MKRLLSWFERKKYTDDTGQVELPSVLASKFEPQNPLEELLIKAGYEPAARPDFERRFLEHEVLIAIRDDGQSAGELENAGDLGIYTLVADDGNNYPIAFTAQDRGYECFGPETLMAKMSGRQLLEMVAEAGVWVNPSSPFGVTWTSENARRILSL